jgi:hypothetical protein
MKAKEKQPATKEVLPKAQYDWFGADVVEDIYSLFDDQSLTDRLLTEVEAIAAGK